MRQLSLIAFDLDGTLVDSRRDIADSANDLLVECGGAALPETAIGQMVGEGAATLVARVFMSAGLPLPADALPRFLAIYDKRLTAHTRPYDGMEGLLESLRGRYTLGVLTNKPLDATRRILTGLNLGHHFDRSLVFGGDGPYPRKPDPAGLKKLAQMAGTDAGHTLMVGDSVIDWRTARAAGAASCIARYGFGFEGFPIEELAAHDMVIDSPEQLARVL